MKYVYFLGTAINLTNASNGMSDYLKGTIITALATGIISIIGFIATTISTKKNLKNELKRQRDNIALERMATVPYKVLALMDEMIEIGKVKDEAQKKRNMEQNIKHFNEIMNTIYSYGSEKSIEIVSLMQKENYEVNREIISLDKFRLMASYVLLVTQIKYDITEISVSPKLWFQMRLTDYEANKGEYRSANNKLINELKLKNEFKIK